MPIALIDLPLRFLLISLFCTIELPHSNMRNEVKYIILSVATVAAVATVIQV